MTMTHLRELARLPVPGDRFVRRGDQLLVGRRYGSPPQCLSVVDISTPSAPRLASSTELRAPMQALALVGDILYVFEYERAIHLVRVDRSPPVTPDCHLMFRQQVYQFARVGERWLVAACNWEGVGAFDVSRPDAPVETARAKLGESFVEGVAVSGGRVFAAAHRDGLVELRIDADGALVEVGRWFGGDDGFDVQRVFVIGDRLWVFGDGALPFEAKHEDEEDDDASDEEPNTVVLDLADLSTPVWVGASPSQPKHMHALPDGGAIVIDGYRCYRFPAAGKPELLFELHETRPDWDGKPDEPRRYLEINATTDRDALPDRIGVMDDAACWIRIGEHLFVQRDSELSVYAISPESPLAQIADG